MKVTATVTQSVDVDPVEVLQKLRTIELGGYNDWIFETNGKYFHGFEQSYGSHSGEGSEEIPKDIYDFIQSIDNAINYLQNKSQDRQAIRG